MFHLSHAARLRSLLLPFLVTAASAQHVFAHRPVFTEDAATSSDTAIPLGKPHVSQVVYREITEERSQVWLGFDVPEGFELFVQIGVPVIDRLKEFRPTMAVVGPGLPDEEVPFDLPEDAGVTIFTTNEVSKPRFFHEHFTGTDSWILRSETLSLPQAGRYYLVAYSPTGQTGKLWLSIGKKESFKLEDLLEFPTWRKKVREFHEVK